jgi:hypothetical protein
MTAAIEKQDYDVARDEMSALLDSLGVSIECEFVPLSRSRNAGEKHLTVNWRVDVRRLGNSLVGEKSRRVLTCDYSQGVAHLQGYDARAARTIDGDAAVRRACETGPVKVLSPYNRPAVRAVAPSREDVLSSLAMDSDVLEYATFEQWAVEFGYDPDSRKGEAIYRQCLETALKLRAALGDAALEQLRELAHRF